MIQLFLNWINIKHLKVATEFSPLLLQFGPLWLISHLKAKHLNFIFSLRHVRPLRLPLLLHLHLCKNCGLWRTCSTQRTARTKGYGSNSDPEHRADWACLAKGIPRSLPFNRITQRLERQSCLSRVVRDWTDKSACSHYVR